MAKVLVKRGSKDQINTAAASNSLNAGEIYLVTDESRLAIGLSSSTFQDMAKLSEIGSVGGGLPSAFSTFSISDGELTVTHSSSFTLSLVDGEFIVDYT